MAQGLEVLIHVQSTISFFCDVVDIRRFPHASLALALCAQWMGSQVHGTHLLPAAVVSSLRSRAPALVDLIVTAAA